MKLSIYHTEYWIHNKIKLPKDLELYRKKQIPSVHKLINIQGGIIEKNFDTQNTMNLFKGLPRGGRELHRYAYKIWMNPGTIINSRKRSAIAKKIFLRLTNTKLNQIQEKIKNGTLYPN